MYRTLTSALQRLCVSFYETDTFYGNDFLPRAAPDDSILISYHSVGNSKNVWRIKETPIPYFYSIDRLGYSGWSELAVYQEAHLKNIDGLPYGEADSFRREISEWLRGEDLSKYKQSDETLPLDSGFIFFPTQIRSDAVSTHNRLNPMRVLDAAARAAKRTKKPLLVKRHPYCTSKLMTLALATYGKTNPLVWITRSSVNSALPACDAVLVGNSGVGLEALVHGKAVYSFASSEYQSATYRVQSGSDVADIFSMSRHRPHPRTSQFVSYYLNQMCFDARSIENTSRRIEALLRSISK